MNDDNRDTSQEYEEVLCEFCNKIIDEIEIHCLDCGNKTESDYCSECDRKLEKINIKCHCPHCGKILQTEIYCIDCSEEISYDERMFFDSRVGEFCHLECRKKLT